jgi:PAS domain S-box-containing protein
MEENTRKQLEEWDVIFNALPDGIFIQDKESKIIKANKAFYDMLHCEPENVIGKKCYDVLHKLAGPWPGCPAEQSKLDKKSYTAEVNDPRIGKPLLVTTAPIINKNGEFSGIVHISKDISFYKIAEKERGRLAAIVESSQDAVIGKTLDGIIFSWNKGAQKTYGYSGEEVIGKSISVLIPAEKIGELDMISKEIGKGKHIEHFETTRIRKDGKLIDVSLALSPIKDDMGNIIGVSTIARDITERKKIEADLKKKMELLERLQRITVDRELKMKELKTEINRLKYGPLKGE